MIVFLNVEHQFEVLKIRNLVVAFRPKKLADEIILLQYKRISGKYESKHKWAYSKCNDFYMLIYVNIPEKK